MGYGCQRDFHLNVWHRINAERAQEDFKPEHNEIALIACVAEELGELAGCILGITGEKARKAHKTKEEALDGVADCMTYLSILASKLGCEDLESLLGNVFNMVSDRVKSAKKVAVDNLGY